MSGIDNRIVTMQFNNAEFERNARTSLTTLQKIKESMSFKTIASGAASGLGSITSALSKIGRATPFAPLIKSATTGLTGVGTLLGKIGLKNPFATSTQGASDLQRAAQAAAGPAGMGHLEGAVTGVSSKFIALSTIAITALSNITNRAVNAGVTWLKSFSVAPIMDGLREYELNLKSIQTVQANTDRPLPEIEDALTRLNEYSDQTIYNFAEMARNVGTFTAAGVDLETSVSSIKGIANLAALSGSSSEQAATAMYQLSQAIAAGKVGLMDWNSVVNAGMGGKKLQNALAQTAVAMGELNANAVKMVGPMKKLEINGSSFRESIMAKPGEESWLSSEALVNTLATMDGRFSAVALGAEKTEKGLDKYTAAQIKAKIETARHNLEVKNGVKYTDEQFEALQQMSTMAFKSATEVKTLGQVFDILKETIASGWSASFKNIFGGLNQAKAIFTPMKDELAGLVEDSARARNYMLADWSEGGGRALMIDGIKNAWTAFLRILKPIKNAFHDIFPPLTANRLIEMSAAFENFTEKLIPSKATMKDIRSIAGGLFSVLSIGKTIFMGLVDGVQALFGAMGGGEGNFLDFAAGIGESITKFDEWLKRSGVVSAFFEGLGKALSVPLGVLKGIGQVIAAMFGGFNPSEAEAVSDAVDNVGNRLDALGVVGQRIRSFFEKIGSTFSGFGEKIQNALMGVGDFIANAFSSENFDKSLSVIQTGLLGGIILLIKNFFKQGVNIDLTGGLFDGIKETLGEATSAFQTMQQNLKASILLKLAAAIGVMALSLLVLSGIDPKALAMALGAMSGGLAALILAMMALMKYLGPVGLAQMYVVTTGMTKMAFSVLLLSFALKTLAGIKFGDMVRGLAGLAGTMFILTKAMLPLAAGSGGMAKASASLILVAIAMNLLAAAVKLFSMMSWEEMGQGLAGVAGAIAGIGIAMRAMPKGILLQAGAILILSVALNALAIAVKVFATMSWEEMGKGLAMVAGALFAIGLGLQSIPKWILLQSVALVAVAGALVILAGVLKVFSKMGWEEIGKGLTMLGGALLVLGIGLQTIGVVGSIGALGLLAAAGAMAVLLPVLLAFSAMSWEGILKSLLMLAGIFTVLGLAAYILAPLVPVIAALALSILALGAGLALMGAGALAAATAFGIVVAAGSAGAQVLRDMLDSIIKSIPDAMKAFADGTIQFARAIAQGAPEIANAFGRVLNGLLDQAIKAIPKVGKVLIELVDTGAKVIVKSAPKIANAGLKLIVALLGALDKNMPKLVDRGVSAAVKFVDGIGKNMTKIIQAGVQLVLDTMKGVRKGIENNDEEFGKEGAKLALAIINGMANAIWGAAGVIKDALVNIAERALDAAKDFLGITSPSRVFRDEVGKPIMDGWAEGIKDGAPSVNSELDTMHKGTMSRLGRAMKDIEDSMSLDPNMNPTITPVLDLSALTQEANKMSSILETAPIIPTVSYQTAADISAATRAAPSNEDEEDSPGKKGGGDTYVTYEQHLHSPKPIDSVEAFRKGRSLIAQEKQRITTIKREDDE